MSLESITCRAVGTSKAGGVCVVLVVGGVYIETFFSADEAEAIERALHVAVLGARAAHAKADAKFRRLNGMPKKGGVSS